VIVGHSFRRTPRAVVGVLATVGGVAVGVDVKGGGIDVQAAVSERLRSGQVAL